MLRDLADQLLAGSCEIAQFLDRCRRHEARANQPVCQQIGDPGRIVHVRLAARDVADVLGVGQHHLEVALEQMPHRLPVHARRLHGHVRDAVLGQPIVQFEQRRRSSSRSSSPHRAAAHSHNECAQRHCPCARRVPHSVDTIPASGHLQIDRVRRKKPSSSNSSNRAPERKRPWQQFGVLAGFRVQLANGLAAPRTNRPRFRRPIDHTKKSLPSMTHPCFIPRGRARRDGQLATGMQLTSQIQRVGTCLWRIPNSAHRSCKSSTSCRVDSVCYDASHARAGVITCSSHCDDRETPATGWCSRRRRTLTAGNPRTCGMPITAEPECRRSVPANDPIARVLVEDRHARRSDSGAAWPV